MLTLATWLHAHIPPEDAGPTGVHKGIVHGDFRLDNLIFHPTQVLPIHCLHIPTSPYSLSPLSYSLYLIYYFPLTPLPCLDQPRVVAVLDWELSTLGNQLSDAAYCCLPYHLPPRAHTLPALSSPLPQGIPSESAFLARYRSSLVTLPASPHSPSHSPTLPHPPLPDPCVIVSGIQCAPLPSSSWPFYVALSLFRGAAIHAGIHQRFLQVTYLLAGWAGWLAGWVGGWVGWGVLVVS